MVEIRLENIFKIYGKKQNVIAVKNLNLCIHEKEFLVLLGPSGCGKTSTLRMIAGLEDISKGTIFFDNNSVNNLSPGERNIAMAFETYALYPTLNVWENIAFPLRSAKMNNNDIKKNVQWAAQTLHISDVLQKRPNELSGGQQQRVSLARAIVRNPNVFLLDEPLSHLDMKQKQHMRAEIKRLNTDLKTTMVYVTHDQKEAMALADRIVVMNKGEVQQEGSPTEIYGDPANEFVAGFVGEPPMNFIDCHIENENGEFYLKTDENLCITRLINANLKDYDNKYVRIGIRPLKIQMSYSQESSESLNASVCVYESIGEKGILSVRMGKQILDIVTKPEQKFDKKSNVWISFPYKDLYFFEHGTGRRLRNLEYHVSE
jgi:multiple sugar transport system ATP-binding protein